MMLRELTMHSQQPNQGPNSVTKHYGKVLRPFDQGWPNPANSTGSSNVEDVG